MEVAITPNEQKYRKLNSWLEVLNHAVQQLCIDQHIFGGVQEIIRRNPKIHRPGDFNAWMARMYGCGMAIAIRRQVDRDSRSISFLRFLEEVKANPTVVSRERFLGISCKRRSSALLASREFDKHVGVGLNHLDGNQVKKEIEKLKQRADALRRYVNKRIAHHDEREFADIPKFRDVDDAVEYLEHLLKRYLLLFRGVGLIQVLPCWQYDWKAVFRLPWIAKAVSSG